MLATLVVLAMVAGIGEGAVLSKCQVKTHIQEAYNKLPKEVFLNVDPEKLTAIAVCYVGLTSGFSTRAVNQLAYHGFSDESNEGREELWTLYGIFQLSDRIMCDSGSVPSLNLCKMDCRDFIDDDISDDIKCVEESMTKLMSFPNEHEETKALLTKMMELLFQPECTNVSYQEYFTDCN